MKKRIESLDQFISEKQIFEANDTNYFAADDGWDVEKIKDTDLYYVLEEAAEIKYEIDNAQRGAYAISGDSDKDLYDAVKELLEKLHNAAKVIDKTIRKQK